MWADEAKGYKSAYNQREEDFKTDQYTYWKNEYKLGSIKEIAIETGGGLVFGSIAGKTNGGILNISEKLQNSSSFYLNGAINQGNYLFHYFSKELQEMQFKLQKTILMIILNNEKRNYKKKSLLK